MSAIHPSELDGVAIVGGGLAGCLLAVYLRQRGIPVDVFESRQDMRRNLGLAGRSINLVLTSRGMHALDQVGLLGGILKICTPVYGRTLHLQNGDTAYQAYGPDPSFCNYSISRADLNVALIKAAVDAGANFHFEHGLDYADLPNKTLFFSIRTPHPAIAPYKAKHIFGCDGAGSKCRQSLKVFDSEMKDEGIPLGAGYKELLMPLTNEGKPAMDVKSLHIWPRGSHFLMALPNLDGTFTMTLYLPETGPVSFASIKTPEQITSYFKQYYPDALTLMPNLVDDWLSHPQGFLGTVKASKWSYGDALVLLGDAAHAITPFFGQGCNAAFEGVYNLNKSLTLNRKIEDVFTEYYRHYKLNADAIASMAVENYQEMMDKTGDQHFLRQKEIEGELGRKYPTMYLSRYALVTHSLVPYHVCVEIGKKQQDILDKICPPTIQDISEVDVKTAEPLIKSLLSPVYDKYHITPNDFRDVSRELVLKNTQSQNSTQSNTTQSDTSTNIQTITQGNIQSNTQSSPQSNTQEMTQGSPTPKL